METPTVNERSSEYVYNGGFSRKFTADRGNSGIQSKSFTLTAGETYRINLYVYGDGIAPLRSGVYMDDDNSSTYTLNGAHPIPPAEWTRYNWSYTPATTGTYWLYAALAPEGNRGTFYIDNVSITQALDINSDCNDNNAMVNPAAGEACNGIDDDCDEQIDEGVKTTYFRDMDGDGHGAPESMMEACSPPSSYVVDNIDLCDGDPNKTDPGICGCGIKETDLDNDGAAECIGAEPVAKIVLPGADLEIDEGSSVTFQCSVLSGKTPYQYVWDFDGGAPDSMDKDPGEVTFNHAGVFNVTLSVSDDNNDVSSDSMTVTVVGAPTREGDDFDIRDVCFIDAMK